MPHVRVLLLLVAPIALGGCAGAPVMLAADVVSAAVKASVEYSEKNRPSPEQQLAQMKLDALRASAEAGEAAAQYALALQLQALASAEAQTWMCRAANQGHARAQLNLGHWYNEDRAREDLWPYIGLSPDNREAYVWYSLSATNGDQFAGHFRRRLLDGPLGAEALAEAKVRLEHWEPSTCAGIAAVAAPIDPGATR